MKTFDLIEQLYSHVLKRNTKITMMGDSAGGGFIFSFCQYLKTIGLPQPNFIVAFSPWVDISLSNPPYDSKNDPILGEIGLREIGEHWAGELSTKDYKVSPIFGDSSGLADSLIFVGTNEIFYKDIADFTKNLKKDGVNVELVVGEELFHIYPLFPIPEAKNAFKKIKNIKNLK